VHQTTVRFDRDLWDELAQAADTDGISVAQYVREAAVARLARSQPADRIEQRLREPADRHTESVDEHRA
jgi:hypothetical protein